MCGDARREAGPFMMSKMRGGRSRIDGREEHVSTENVRRASDAFPEGR